MTQPSRQIPAYVLKNDRPTLLDNGELVAKVVRIAKELGREIANPAEARQILSLKK